MAWLLNIWQPELSIIQIMTVWQKLKVSRGQILKVELRGPIQKLTFAFLLV